MPRALMGAFNAFTGNLREGAADMQKELAAIEQQGDPVSSAIIADFLALTYARLGEFAAAEATIAHSEQLAGEGDEIARVDVDIARSAIHLERGELEDASHTAARCAERAEALGAFACVVASSLMVGAARLARDDPQAARAPLERGEELSTVTNMAPMRTLIRGFLGSVRTETGDLPRGAASWEQALADAQAMSDRFGEAQTLWARARTRVRQPQPNHDEAMIDLDRSIELFAAMEAKPALARALLDRAAVLRSLGRDAESDADRRRSRELAAPLGLKDAAFA